EAGHVLGDRSHTRAANERERQRENPSHRVLLPLEEIDCCFDANWRAAALIEPIAKLCWVAPILGPEWFHQRDFRLHDGVCELGPFRRAGAIQRAVQSDDITLCFTDRKSTRLNSSHRTISYAVFCLKKKTS